MNIRIFVGDWNALKKDAQFLRTDVFIIEQGVPRFLEWDEDDQFSLHAVAYDEKDKPVATGRLLPNGYIGRMAVKKNARKKGIGSKILKTLIDRAIANEYKEIFINAQKQTIPFYIKHKFTTIGNDFIEASMPHILMYLKL
tara:strand:+ start:362 stop:784 length:423 start_codon:yes stop_codon:yes gene_type:complete